MANFPKISTHLGYFSSGADRYNPTGYKEDAPSVERIRLVSKVSGLDGVELNYPTLANEETIEEVKSVLEETGLEVSNVSLNVWGQGRWGLGALTNPDPAVRAEALRVIKRGIDVAKVVGAPLVSLWPGQDGFDYPFQVDYGAAYDWFVQGMREAAAYDPEMRICLEYKLKEPRTHLLVDTAARAMWLIGKIGAPNVGVLLDLGHALCAYENIAQSAVLLHREGLLDLLHFNDNYGEWDWDMIPGTVRFWEYLELFFWLHELGYDKWYSIDITMPRGDSVEACQQSVDNIRRMYSLAERLDHTEILANIRKHSGYLENLRLVSDTIFGVLKP